MATALELAPAYLPVLGAVAFCAALGISRATLHRARTRRPVARRPSVQPRALSTVQLAEVIELLNSERFVDQAPSDVCATLLDEGRYVCSERTMYRVLKACGEVRERRAQRRHPEYKKPELIAVRPNQVWSWDITKLRGPGRLEHFSLYVMLDIFSRMVVGWLIADGERSLLAKRFIRETYERQGVKPRQLTIHADRGTAMTSQTTSQLLASLGVTQSHSRPHVSNDNPFSEALFKTVKYWPEFPNRFGSLEDARSYCVRFFDWYNYRHHHSALRWLTPHDVHSGRAPALLEARAKVMQAFYAEHPERFAQGAPKLQSLPTAVWINPPRTSAAATQSPSLRPNENEGSRT